MFVKKIVSVLILTLLAGCAGGGGTSSTSTNCNTYDSCINDPNCKCWCSVQCGYRKKTSADRPVYIENDPNGKSCYCKQWDLDNYDSRCGSNAQPQSRNPQQNQNMMNDGNPNYTDGSMNPNYDNRNPNYDNRNMNPKDRNANPNYDNRNMNPNYPDGGCR